MADGVLKMALNHTNKTTSEYEIWIGLELKPFINIRAINLSRHFQVIEGPLVAELSKAISVMDHCRLTTAGVGSSLTFGWR